MSCECGETEGGGLHAKGELVVIGVSLIVFVLGLIFQDELHKTPGAIAEYALFLAVYVVIGWRVLLTALRNIFRGRLFDENFLMSIATLGAIVIHQLPEGVAVLLFYRVGEYLQDLAVGRSRRSIRSLLALRPDYANVVVADRVEKMAPEEVEVGQVILVRPGERIPLDGQVLEGTSQLDTSVLTGESIPRRVRAGDAVMGGMVNKEGLLRVRVTHRFAESSVAKILQLVETADSKKAPTEKLITRLARYYTPLVVIAAIAVAVIPPLIGSPLLLRQWIYRALTLLVISCPCGLVISIPLGYFGGVGGAAKRGILVKGSTFLDQFTRLAAVAFDKTGTLTQGSFNVTSVVPMSGFAEEELLRLSAKAELHSNHPLAAAIRRAFQGPMGVEEIRQVEEIPAHGVRAEVEGREVLVGSDRLMHREKIAHDTCLVEGTVAHVAVDGQYGGYIVVADEIREDSKLAVENLKALGIGRVEMLTGDNPFVAARVAKELGVSFMAELLPEDKVSRIEELMQEVGPKGTVAFVGDGINDAPVLKRADIGIAMGGLGSDTAIETADVVIMTDHPSKVPEAIKASRKTLRIVVQNIVFALTVKAVMVVLGAFGWVNMWEAVFADVGVALIAILNSTRALSLGKRARDNG